MKPFVFIIFIIFTLGGTLFSQRIELDTAFEGSKIYGISSPECITTWSSGNLAVAGDINHTIDKFTLPDYQYDSSFNTTVNTYANSLVPVGDTIILQHVSFYGFDQQGNEVMHDFRVEQQNEMFVSGNYNNTPPYFDRKTGYLYAACSGLDGTPCWGGVPDRFFYRLTPEGKLDTTFLHPMNRGISKIQVISENRILLTGTFSNYDGNIRKKLAFVDQDFNLLPEILDPQVNTLYYSTLRSLITDSFGRSILTGDFYFSDSNQIYNLIRIDSLGNLDTTFHYWNFPDDNGYTSMSTGINFKDRIILSGFFTSVQGYERNGIVALYESGDIDTTLFNVGFTSVLNPVLGIPPYVYQFASWENNLFCVGNFMSYENKTAMKLARFIYTDETDEDTVTEINCPSVLFPNPVTATLNICGKNGIPYQVTDATGRKIAAGNINADEYVMDVSDFNSGMYFLRLLTSEKFETHRFIKL